MADIVVSKVPPVKTYDIFFYVEASAAEDTSISGEVFDIKHKCKSGQIVTDVSADWTNRGILFPGIGGPLPIPIYLGRGGTKSEACKAFGEEVVKFLIGQETNQ